MGETVTGIEERGGTTVVRTRSGAEIEAIAFEGQAHLVSGCSPDRALRLEGFLCAKSQRSKKLVLHVTRIEFVEGD